MLAGFYKSWTLTLLSEFIYVHYSLVELIEDEDPYDEDGDPYDEDGDPYP